MKRKKGDSWEYVVKRAKLLPRPWRYYTNNEEEGDAYIAKIEALLDNGIVPPELDTRTAVYTILAEVIRGYLAHNTIPQSDVNLLNVAYARIGATPIKLINYVWVEKWIRSMKIELNIAPSTIRHHVGALARCFDWASNKNIVALALNPIRQLPKRYAQYTDKESFEAAKNNPHHTRREDVSRDRRVGVLEEPAIRAVMAGAKSADKQRALEMRYQAAIEMLFDLALETAMRMREMYTLTLDQLNFELCTIFLEKTKNGSKRQVPLSTVAVAKLREYLEHVGAGTRGMEDFKFNKERLFPWWDGGVERQTLERLSAAMSQQYSRVFETAGCPDLTFHDLRHEATSRFFERTTLSDTEIMKITGHSSTRMLARYANLRGSNLAGKLW